MIPSGIMRCSTLPQVFLPRPFAGLLEAMMAGKFEWQFKYRDEADVNAPWPRPRTECQKSPFDGHFCDLSDSVYPAIFGQR
ncbi:hypothetical protein DXU04_40410 [Bradyrhizobium diazoefficiens]|nr:hypothetical protein BD122_21090 [Bradyrhizobium diazoefficiens]KOY08729.1 hypothetical protein AF336_19660 [Bradyrhizobium diazoefficiens]QHP69926.1 hypothetical protein EI171_23095 [Bradyrhizobium sp. LCT2]